MAYEFYVSVKGTKQGQFKGESVKDKRKEKFFAGLGFGYEIQSPRDVATGQASGKRQHGAVKFVKEWGAATPQLLTAASTNEVLTEVLFEFIKTNATGEEYVYHKIKLTNATVSKIEQMTGITGGSEGSSSAKHEAAKDTHELERIHLTFQKIEHENTDGKTMYLDDWHAQGG